MVGLLVYHTFKLCLCRLFFSTVLRIHFFPIMFFGLIIAVVDTGEEASINFAEGEQVRMYDAN